MDDGISWDSHAVAEENFLLPVEREVIDVFANEQVSEQSGGGQASDKRGGGCGRDDGRKVALGLAAELRTHDEASEKPGRGDVEQLGGFFSDALEGVRIGGDEVGDDFPSVVSTGRFSKPVMRERWAARFFGASAFQRRLMRPPPVRPRRGRLPTFPACP